MVGILGGAVYSYAATTFHMALLMLLVNAGLLLGNLVGGTCVDALGPRKTLLSSLASMAALGALYLALPATLASLIVVCALYIFVYGCAITCFTALPPFVAAPAALARTNALLSTAENAAYIAGPLVGGVITLVWDVRGCFVVLALCALAALVPAWFLPLHELAPANDEKNLEAEQEREASHHPLHYAREGFRACFAQPILATIVNLSFLAFFAYGAFDALETVFYRDVLHVGVEWTGWLGTAVGVGATVGSLALMRLPQRLQTLQTGAYLALLVGAGTILYVGTANPYIAALGQFTLGVAFGLFEPLMALIAQRLSPPQALGRVMAVLRVCQRLSGVVPLAAAPFLAQAFGVQTVLVTAGCLVTGISALFAFIIVPRVTHASHGEGR